MNEHQKWTDEQQWLDTAEICERLAVRRAARGEHESAGRWRESAEEAREKARKAAAPAPTPEPATGRAAGGNER